jgi:prephenate dehydrogenase
MMFDTVCIAGLGLAGTSLGLALGALARRRVGWDTQMERAEAALAAGALDEVSVFPQDHVEGADLLIVAAPTAGVEKVARTYGPLLRAGAVLMDLRPQKGEIGAIQARLVGGGEYVGSAPLLWPGARAALASAVRFAGARCLVTAASLDSAGVRRVSALWEALGARPVVVAAHRHDAVAAALYHGPLALEAARVMALRELGEGLLEVEAPAWQEAGWVEALAEARGPLLSVLGRHRAVLEDLIGRVERQEWAALREGWEEA